jgi:hypothetical protein
MAAAFTSAPREIYGVILRQWLEMEKGTQAMSLKRISNWTLTLHWFSHVPEGVMPVQMTMGQMFSESAAAKRESRPEHPGLYSTHEWTFTNPPSRADFLAALKMSSWSAQAYRDDLIPLVESGRCQWPMIDAWHKGAHTDLTHESGRLVGRLEVWRQHVYGNVASETCPVDVGSKRQVLSRLRGERREAAAAVIDANENRIRERMTTRCRGRGSADLLCEIELVVAEAGLFNTSVNRRIIKAHEAAGRMLPELAGK